MKASYKMKKSIEKIENKCSIKKIIFRVAYPEMFQRGQGFWDKCIITATPYRDAKLQILGNSNPECYVVEHDGSISSTPRMLTPQEEEERDNEYRELGLPEKIEWR